MSELLIIGLNGPRLLAEQCQLLDRATLVVGTERLLEAIRPTGALCRPITPLSQAIEAIRAQLPEGKVIVLASGDPLFYGIARRLFQEFPNETITVHPALSSIQLACALFQISWDDARIISLHGRAAENLPGRLLQSEKTLILTDQLNSPNAIAAELLNYFDAIGETILPGTIEMLVAEDLATDSERVTRTSLASAAELRFSPLNIVCILNTNAGATPPLPEFSFGLSEEEILHSRGLITKNEVRAATLHQLCLPRSGVFWDVGGGSGSLSIEAARLNPELRVYTIERNPEELANIRHNIRTYRCFNISPVPGAAPEPLIGLPDPDRVFIGGSGGHLEQIVEIVSQHLRPGGKVVMNGVIAKTIEQGPRILQQYGFTVLTTELKVTRTDANGSPQTFNPITIITGTR